MPVDFGEVTSGNLACGTQVFSLNGGVPAGVPSVFWTLTPSHLFTVSSGSGTSVTPQIIGSGQGTLTFFLNSPCGNVEFAKKVFWAGLPPAPKLFILYGGRQITQEPLVAPPDGFVCYRGSTRFKADNLQLNAGVTSFEWIIGCGNVVQTLNVLNSSTRGVMWFDIGSCTETIIRVRARNACGVSAWTDLPLTFMECQMMRPSPQYSNDIVISPNPTSDFLNLDLPKSEQGYQIQLSDLQGKFLFFDKINEEKYKLDLQNYPSGIYILHLNDGDKISIHKIVKQ
ncbi:MAG: T9SS C-terminal target domain-containing protein [Bacteroidetes bacterium]|nr:MAG: T9SS C-terminal target domain-containing protein [Bacteroidota bacterium]TAG92705.1 MAG: T9SS C-terminal target domain-containing protein [Bacteroidota bacterium]